MSDETSDQRNGTSAGTVAIALLCGAAIGATVALLFAPKTGAELRRDLSETTDRLRRRVTTAVNGAVHTIDSVDTSHA